LSPIQIQNEIVTSWGSSSLPTAEDESQDRDGLSPVLIQTGAFGSTFIRIRDLGVQNK